MSLVDSLGLDTKPIEQGKGLAASLGLDTAGKQQRSKSPAASPVKQGILQRNTPEMRVLQGNIPGKNYVDQALGYLQRHLLPVGSGVKVPDPNAINRMGGDVPPQFHKFTPEEKARAATFHKEALRQGVLSIPLERIAQAALLPKAARALREVIPAAEESIALRQGAKAAASGTPSAKNAAYRTGGLVDSLRTVFNPAARGPLARETAETLRAGEGEMRRNVALKTTEVKPRVGLIERTKRLFGTDSPNPAYLHRYFQKMPEAEQVGFIDKVERGQINQLPREQQPIATELRRYYDDAKSWMVAHGRDEEEFLRDYLARALYEDPAEAEGVAAHVLNVAKGSKQRFLKERYYQYLTDAIKPEAEGGGGLMPTSTNPIDHLLAYHRQFERYKQMTEFSEHLRNTGIAKELLQHDRPSEGMVGLGDTLRSYFPTTKAGSYWAIPQEAKTIIDNYLGPGLRGQPLFEMVRAPSAFAIQMRLALSAFHADMVGSEGIAGSLLSGLREMTGAQHLADVPGNVARGVGRIASSPLAPAMNQIRGKSLLQVYFGEKEGSVMEQAAVRGMTRSNMSVGVPKEVEYGQVENLLRSVRLAREHWAAGRKGMAVYRGAEAAGKALPTVLRQTSRWLFDTYVPRAKAAAFSREFSDEVALRVRNLGRELTSGEIDNIGFEVGKTIENRMGMLRRSNLFLHPVFRDLLDATFLSAGWQIGDVTQATGAIRELVTTPSRLAAGDALIGRRMAWIASVPIATYMANGIYQVLHGQGAPKDLEDWKHPRNGLMLPDGSPQRSTAPTYMRDFDAYSQAVRTGLPEGAPGITRALLAIGQHKLNPLANTAVDVIRNKNFFDQPIYDPDAALSEQIKQQLLFVWTGNQPYSVQQAQQSKQQSGQGLFWDRFAGWIKTPRAYDMTPAEKMIAERRPQSSPFRRPQQVELAKAKSQIRRGLRQGDDVSQILSQYNDYLSPNERKLLQRQARMTPFGYALQSIHSADDLAAVAKAANEEEKKDILRVVSRRMKGGLRTHSRHDMSVLRSIKNDLSGKDDTLQVVP